MDKLALIFVGIFVMTGTHLVINSQSNLSESEIQLAEGQYEILARNAALAGLDRVKQNLADAFHSYSGVTGTNDGASYVVNAIGVGGNQVIVRSTGTAYTTNGDPIEFNVQAKFKRRTVLPSEAPPFMRHAVIADLDLVLRGNLAGEVYADGNENNQLNANMHTNSNLSGIGNSFLIKGFGTFQLTASPSEASLADNFAPNHNPANAPSCYQTDELPIPSLNPAVLAGTLPVDSTSPGDILLTGSHTLGTRDNPYIWHIEGNLSIHSGGTTINGYVMFLVDGAADLRGNVEVGTSGYTGGDESSIAIYTGLGVRMRGNSEIWGQIYSNGGIEFESGTPTVYGSVTTKGAVDFRGTVDIYYRKASPALTTPFQPNISVLDRIAYSEW